MIIGFIINIIKKLMDLLTSFIAWLLIALGLWVPLLYTLGFVIFCAVKEIELTSVTSLYYFGLFLSLVASVALSVNAANRKVKKREKRQDIGKDFGKKQPKVTLVRSQDDSLVAPQTDSPAYAESKHVKKEKRSKKEDDMEDTPLEDKKPSVNIIEAARAESNRKLKEEGYSVEEEEAPPHKQEEQESRREDYARQNADYESAPTVNQNYNGGIIPSEAQRNDLNNIVTKGGYNPSEMPRIFATRKDPTVFIYEYSNRIDYYKRTRGGMIYMYSEYKR